MQLEEIKIMRLGAATNLTLKVLFKIYKSHFPHLYIQQQIVDELNAKHEYIKLTEQVIEKQQIEMDKLISYIWR